MQMTLLQPDFFHEKKWTKAPIISHDSKSKICGFWHKTIYIISTILQQINLYLAKKCFSNSNL